jgi:hypothetical protein
MVAVLNYNGSIVEILLEAGANIELTALVS